MIFSSSEGITETSPLDPFPSSPLVPPVFMQISKTNKEYKPDHLDFRLSQQIKLDLANTRRNPEGITTVFHSDLEHTFMA